MAPAVDGKRRARRVTEADRIAWREWARERAQEAFRRGREATERGLDDLALRWLERAHRLAPDAPAVIFPLAVARAGAGDPHGAAALLRPLLKRGEFREGWVMLAAACRAAGDLPGAAAALQRALSGHAPDPAAFELMTAVALAAGRSGWCGLRGDGSVLVDGTEPDRDGWRGLAMTLDGMPVAGAGKRGGGPLPRRWRAARELAVFRNGAALLGSPVRIQAVLRVDGFVEATATGLRGWAWHPGEPDRVPVLTLRTAAGTVVTAAMDVPDEAVPADAPLARPRMVAFPDVPDLLDGPVTVEDANGRALFGSPLDPGLELRAAAAVASRQARFSLQRPRTGRPPSRRPTGTGMAATGTAADTADALPPFLPVDAALFGRSAVPGPRRAVDVVVPVFRHERRTLDCLRSVEASVPPGTRIVVVEDASPEPELVAALVALAAAKRIRLIRRPRNGGFPASANDGIAACPDRDVVLLNSDTLVAPGWIEALRRAAYAAEDVGTATPFSNDASILSYPRHRDLNPAPDLDATTRLMALAADANGEDAVDIPTGNGFCFYLRRDCLDQVGLFREDLFAQGYGEENDLCLRARHLGWRHVAAPGAFVAHHGNTSFGPARTELMRRNLAILNRLHPGYDALVAAHIEADPLRDARRRLDVARWNADRGARGSGPGPGDGAPRAALLLTHDQGGGVERVVRERARLLWARGLRPVILRPVAGREGAAVSVSDGGTVEDYPNLVFELPGEFDALCALLEGDGVQHGEWHHLLGHHPAMRALCGRLGVPFDVFVHDYGAFCQRIALVGPNGRYCGEPDPEGCERCVAAQGSALYEDIAVRPMLQRSAAEFSRARRVVAPSRDAATRMERHFPGLRVTVEFWEDDRPDLTLERLAAVSSQAPRPGGRRTGRESDSAPVRVVVVGGIGREKGLDVLRGCLDEIRRRHLPLEFVVVGHTPDDAALIDTGACFVSGEYREEEAVSLIRAQEADLALLPSVWPETWCFTLSLAWRAGLKVAAFDLGAPAERIRRTGRGALLPLGLPVPDLVDVLLRLGGRPESVISSSPVGREAIAERRPPSHHHARARGNG
ncbi:MAG: glycosyltransferase [Gluconacetobacter diazotrophicus]|nr:glycosyltransferase [Gluconacetobacter diazotrophicus]